MVFLENPKALSVPICVLWEYVIRVIVVNILRAESEKIRSGKLPPWLYFAGSHYQM